MFYQGHVFIRHNILKGYKVHVFVKVVYSSDINILQGYGVHIFVNVVYSSDISILQGYGVHVFY